MFLGIFSLTFMSKKNSTPPLSYFYSYLKHYTWRITFVFLILFAAKVATVLAPLYLKNIVDYLQKSITETVLWETMLIALATYFGVRMLGLILGELKDFLFVKVETRITRTISREIFEHLLNLSTRFHLEKKSGAIAAIIQRGTAGLAFVFRFSLFNIFPTLIEILLIVVILLLNYNPVFAIITFSTLVLYIAYTIFIIERRASVQRQYNTNINKAQGIQLDSLTNIDTVQLFTNKSYEVGRYDEVLAEVEQSSYDTKKFLFLTNIGQGTINTVGVIALLYFATSGVLDNTMTIGDFTLMIAYVTQLSIPLGFLGSVYRQIKDSLVNMEDMFALFNVPEEIADNKNGASIGSFTTSLQLNDVTFSYDKTRTVLHHLSIAFPKGKTTAIVGPSGSGKTSISKLLLRMYDIEHGSITIDEANIKDVPLDNLRSLIGLVPQDTTLFNETVGFNIAYGKPGASQAEIEEAARKAHIHDFIASLPEGYNTIVGERGLRLSGGEKQRVAIARVILKGSPILLFDEATSSLDSKSESIIQRAILSLSKERTMIIIAHRLSTIVHADNIIVLQQGELIEQGNHKELLKKNGLYAELWAMQEKEAKERKE